MTLSRRQALGMGVGTTAALLAGFAGGPALTAPRSGAPGSIAAPGPATTLPPVRHEQSLPALMRRTFASAAPDRRRQVTATDAWTKYLVVYPSGDLDISGVLYVPRGAGPFPAVVLAHGYSRPGNYSSGKGMEREQSFLAGNGFVVLHTDYRGHAASSTTEEMEMELGLGFAEDALNAAQSLKLMPEVHPEKVAMFGLSMGGGVTCNALVAGPGIVRAAVTWASVSSLFADNYQRLIERRRPDRVDDIRRRYGPPTDDNTFYADLSSRTFFDRVTEPVLLDHGKADSICPVHWSRATARALRQAGVDVRLHQRRFEDHIYSRRWQKAMDDTHAFLRERLEL